jgi:hypothetical protein
MVASDPAPHAPSWWPRRTAANIWAAPPPSAPSVLKKPTRAPSSPAHLLGSTGQVRNCRITSLRTVMHPPCKLVHVAPERRGGQMRLQHGHHGLRSWPIQIHARPAKRLGPRILKRLQQCPHCWPSPGPERCGMCATRIPSAVGPPPWKTPCPPAGNFPRVVCCSSSATVLA